jgi:hypothetical protein
MLLQRGQFSCLGIELPLLGSHHLSQAGLEKLVSPPHERHLFKSRYLHPEQVPIINPLFTHAETTGGSIFKNNFKTFLRVPG